MSHPQHLKDRFIEMRAAGFSFEKISATIGVSKPTLATWWKTFKEMIAALEYVNAQALMEKYLLTRQAQLEEDVKELVRIRKAIKLKDLTKENITTLVEMRKLQEEKISMRMDVLEENAKLTKAGMDKDILTACTENANDRAEGLMDKLFEQLRSKIRNIRELSDRSPQDIANELCEFLRQSINEGRDANTKGSEGGPIKASRN